MCGTRKNVSEKVQSGIAQAVYGRRQKKIRNLFVGQYLMGLKVKLFRNIKIYKLSLLDKVKIYMFSFLVAVNERNGMKLIYI